MDNTTVARAKRIRDKIPSIKRRLRGKPIGLRSKDRGHASTSRNDIEATRLNITDSWARTVSDKRLQATMYHESMHFDHFYTQKMRGGHLSDLREFHANARELRHAMKHDLFTPREFQSKVAKLQKFGGRVKTSHGYLSGNIDRQLKRVARGKPPAKHNVRYWNKRLRS